MWLPVFVLIGALMVNLGTMQTWRLRGEVAARSAALGSRWPRQTWHVAPLPESWRGVSYDVAFVAPPAEFDPVALHYPAVRGPVDGIRVLPLLDPDTLPALVGQARVQRPLPMVRSMAPYDSAEIRQVMLDGTFSAREMRLPGNTLRRTKRLYVLPLGGAP